MWRVRLVALAFLAAFLGGLLFWPVVLTCTFVWGEKATAHVAECHVKHNTKGSETICTGLWTTSHGFRGAGKIYGLNEDQAGHDVSVRIGPMGPYAGGFGHSWVLFLSLAPIIGSPPFIVVMNRRMTGPSKALAKKLLATPGDGLLLIVNRGQATTVDERPYATFRKADPPPGYQPLKLPPGTRRQLQRSTFEAAAGIGSPAARLSGMYGPGGEPLFLYEQRSQPDYEPDALLLDPGGTTLAVIRQIAMYPAACNALNPDGSPLAYISTPRGIKSMAFEFKDLQGRVFAVFAANGLRTWVLHVHPWAPPLLRNLCLGFSLAVFDIHNHR
jgi:hypothetical protein